MNLEITDQLIEKMSVYGDPDNLIDEKDNKSFQTDCIGCDDTLGEKY